MKSKFTPAIVLVTLLMAGSQANAQSTANAAQQASGNCALEIRRAITKFTGKRITAKMWADQYAGYDPKVWPQSINIITAGYTDQKYCLNSFDVSIVPTQIEMQADQTMGASSPKLPTATSCNVTSVKLGDNPVDCG